MTVNLFKLPTDVYRTSLRHFGVRKSKYVMSRKKQARTQRGGGTGVSPQRGERPDTARHMGRGPGVIRGPETLCAGLVRNDNSFVLLPEEKSAL